MSKTFSLVLGTSNHKKGEELAALLDPYGFRLSTLADHADSVEVDETGTTFAENAALKATCQARTLGQWVMGEDSGICVDALEGRPGVYSARYSGEDATDEANNRLLLKELGDLPLEKRNAHYECHVCIADPRGEVRATSTGFCRGRIRFVEAGSAGFGYDPLFEISEYHRTFGELGQDAKSILSHRARALRQIIPQLVRLAQSGAWFE